MKPMKDLLNMTRQGPGPKSIPTGTDDHEGLHESISIEMILRS